LLATKTKGAVKVVEVPVLQRLKAGRQAVVMGVLGWGESKLPRAWRSREWWTSVSLERQAKACVPEGDLDVAGVEGVYVHSLSLR